MLPAQEYGILTQMPIPGYGDFYVARLPGYGAPVALVASDNELFMTVDTARRQPHTASEINQYEWYGLKTEMYAINIDGLPRIVR